MEEAPPLFYKSPSKLELVAASLGLKSTDFVSDYPIEIVSTGLRDLIIPVKNTTILQGILPDFNQIKAISRKLTIIGYHVFALNQEEQKPIQCRNFAPLVGVDEEYATGTSNGALACYLFQQKQQLGNQNYDFLQGRQCNEQRGQIFVELKATKGQIKQVYVGGRADLRKTLS